MAAVDYFLKIDGIEGESTDSKHPKEIELESWSGGATNSGQSQTSGRSGGGTGRVTFQDFHFVKHTDKSSAKLMLACATGEHIPKAVLTCRKAGTTGQVFMTVTMEHLLVSSFQTGGSGHSDIVPTDQISMNFTKIKIEYKEQKADGSLGGATKAGYDIKSQKKV